MADFTSYVKTADNATVVGITPSGQNVAFESWDQFLQSGGSAGAIKTVSSLPSYINFSQWKVPTAAPVTAPTPTAGPAPAPVTQPAGLSMPSGYAASSPVTAPTTGSVAPPAAPTTGGIAPPTVGVTQLTKTANDGTVYGQLSDGKWVGFQNEAQITAAGGNLANVKTVATAPAGFTPYDQYLATQARTAAADTANTEAQKIFDQLKTGEIDTRQSTKLLADITAKLSEAPPPPPSMLQTFQQQSEALGINTLNTKLTELDTQLKTIDTNLLTESDKAGDRVQSMTEITRRRGTLQKEADIRKAYISLERDAVARQLNSKVSMLNMVMEFTGQDYQNATTYYNAQLERSLKLYDVVNGREEADKSEQDKAGDLARANLSVMQGLMADGKVTYDKLTSQQKTQLSLWELQAGLPAGLTAQISNLPAISGGKVLTTSSGQAPDGRVIFNTLVQMPNGSFETVTTYGGIEKMSSSGGGARTGTQTERDRAALATDRDQMADAIENDGYLGGDGFLDPDDYESYKNSWTYDGNDAEDFDSMFAKYRNPKQGDLFPEHDYSLD